MVGRCWVWRGDPSSTPARRAAEIDELEQLYTFDSPDVDPELDARVVTPDVADDLGEAGALTSSSARLSRAVDILTGVAVVLAAVVIVSCVAAVTAVGLGRPAVVEVFYWVLIAALALAVTSGIAALVLYVTASRGAV
jgi:hypothetical protein